MLLNANRVVKLLWTIVVEHLIVSELSKEPLDYTNTIAKSANCEFVVNFDYYKAASSNMYI